MKLELAKEQERRLRAAAARIGKTPTTLLIDAAISVIEIDAYHLAAIDRAIAQIDRGEIIQDEEMDARVAKMLAQ